MWYNVDFAKLLKMLLPSCLRKANLFAYFFVFFTAIRYVYRKFILLHDSAEQRLSVTCQVAVLQKALNDRFFLRHDEIYIDDITEELPVLYKRAENDYPSVILYKRSEKEYGTEPVYIRKRTEGRIGGDFTVYVPSFLNKTEYMGIIKNLLDYYRPAGRNYKIVIYEYE